MIQLAALMVHRHMIDGGDDVVRSAIENGLLTVLVADFDMSEHRIGGDDLTCYVDQVIEQAKMGREVKTFYGQDGGLEGSTDVLIVGFDNSTVTII